MNAMRILPILSLVALAVRPLAAGAAPPPPSAAPAAAEKEKKAPEEKQSTTEHQIVVGGRTIAYSATAGNLVLKQEDGTARASIFFTAYSKKGENDPARRPVTFCFNGGPGSSSVWLHLGVLGPRRVKLEDEGWAPRPPYELTDNDESILDLTDLVFVDPVTTGFSRAAPGVDDHEFHGVREDIESVGEFVRLWTSRYGRWASPKFLAGESYGTTRAAGLVDWLQDRHGMYFSGVVLISAVLDFGTGEFQPGNDAPYALFLPTYAATAWYHHKLAPELEAAPVETVVEEARRFARGDYWMALSRGNRLAAAEREAVAEKLARLTGLSKQYCLDSDLRIADYRFPKELLRSERATTGRLDTRFRGRDLDAAGESTEFDPSYAAIQGPFSSMLNDYLKRELKVEQDLPYEVLTGRVQPWSFRSYENRYVDVAENLRQALEKNPALRVFVANGYYDLATPFAATEYTLDHLAWDGDAVSRVEMHYFPAGHMMYIHRPSREKLKADLAAFYAAAVAGR